MSPGVLLVISPRMQKLTPNPVRDFASVCLIARFVTSNACENNGSGNSPARQLLGSAGCQAVISGSLPRTLAFHMRDLPLLAVRQGESKRHRPEIFVFRYLQATRRTPPAGMHLMVDVRITVEIGSLTRVMG